MIIEVPTVVLTNEPKTGNKYVAQIPISNTSFFSLFWEQMQNASLFGVCLQIHTELQ